MRGSRFLIAGGTGFIGSHFTDRLLLDPAVQRVALYDNFSSGRAWHHQQHSQDPRFRVVVGDVKDLDSLKSAMAEMDVVIHLASNPDIARATTEPDIDFREGTALTQNILEAMRATSATMLLYASGSGVYGDLGLVEAHEDHGPLLPISTYGASKLAGETLISAYCHMFGLRACAFRFANVVGPRQTHGVALDFVRRLAADSSRLRILGDGMQSKSYIHVQDVIEAVLTAHEHANGAFNVYNVATEDYITVNEIARLAIQAAGCDPKSTVLEHTGGDRGWKGDVPVVRLNTTRIRSLGWVCRRNCRQALLDAIVSMIEDNRRGRL